jgi:hypothetical protein
VNSGNHIVLSALTAFLLIGSVNSAFSQYTNSSLKSVEAKAEIIAGIALTKTQDLDFGVIVSNAGGGTVTLDQSNTISTTGGLVTAQGSVNKQAMFSVSGQPGYQYDVGLPNTPITISAGFGKSMSVGSFKSFPDAAAPITLDAGGFSSFDVGATLTVGAAQEPGVYSGTFDVSVAYH